MSGTRARETTGMNHLNPDGFNLEGEWRAERSFLLCLLFGRNHSGMWRID
jgi:hypothetical protein